MVTLVGSDRQPFANAISVGPAHPDERLEITMMLHPDDRAGLQDHVSRITQGLTEPISRSEYATKHATTDVDLQKVISFAASNDLTVVSIVPHAHRVILEATVARVNAAFGVDLQCYSHDDGTYRGRVGTIELPQELDGVVHAVLGLDNRPAAQPHFQNVTHGNVRWSARSASHYPNAIADMYNFPPGDGHGQCIAIIELGGGFRNADLTNYFVSELNFAAAPSVTAVSVDHATNAPTGNPNGPDGEVMLDIEVAGSIAPHATLAVYFTPNTDAGFLNAITTAMHDTVNHPTVMSISWGGPENYWSVQAMNAFDAAFRQAAALGITVTVASGDNGSGDGESGNHVDFPASSPHVLACGGTNIQTNNNIITNETVWNNGPNGGASGGGFSTLFYSFDWQKNIVYEGQSLHRRGVPDVCGAADPATGYNVLVDGQLSVFGGTSAVAPLWAALIARINSNRGKNIGWVHSTMYAHPAAFHDITFGSNGSFAAAPGWDATTGLGSPNGGAIAALFP